jgi:hypothetical protein
LYNASQISFEEFGAIIQATNIGILLANQSKDLELFTVTTIKYFEDADQYIGFAFLRYLFKTLVKICVFMKQL